MRARTNPLQAAAERADGCGVYPGDDERTRRAFQPSSQQPGSTAVPAPVRRTVSGRATAVAVCAVLLSVGAGWRMLPWQHDPPPAGASALALGDLPPLPADARATRIHPEVVTLLTGEHAFLRTRPDGTPVAPDPCRPFHYAINPAGMPQGTELLVREAIAFVSEYTGLAFVEDPFTDETVDELREPVQAGRYGDRWAPLLVAMADEAVMESLGGSTAAVAQPHTVATSGPDSERVVTGQIALDSAFTVQAVRAPAGQATMRLVLMHELGHIVGLDHVADPTQIMHDTSTGYHYLGNGDRQGRDCPPNGVSGPTRRRGSARKAGHR